MLYLGETARELRKELGLSQRETATKLGVSNVHLCNIENNNAQPSQALLEKYSDIWGVDLYVLAWCRLGDTNKLPKAIRGAALQLSNAWKEQIGIAVARARRAEVK